MFNENVKPTVCGKRCFSVSFFLSFFDESKIFKKKGVHNFAEVTIKREAGG